MKKTLFVSAMNVHVGGGRALLDAVLQSLPDDLQVIALLDVRMKIPDNCMSGLQIRTVRPTALARMSEELWLARHVQPGDIVLCFGNLPPLFPLPGRVVVFLQNRYLVDPVSLARFALKTRVRLWMERLWLRSRAGAVHAFIVQTPSMQRLTQAFAGRSGQQVRLLPFAERAQEYVRSLTARAGGDGADFIYVASGEPHKNHRSLIEAWGRLAREGRFPSLWLTLDRQANQELCHWIEREKEQWGLRVENLGVQTHARIQDLYKQARALIYPSTFESFGLPLIEARQAGIAVLAAELDYVRDVLDPEQSFDPVSATSIARAVKRFMEWSEEPLPLANARAFLQTVLERSDSP